MNTSTTVQVSSEALLQRIDAIMRELQDLRQIVSSQSQPQEPPPDIVAQLAGALAPKPRPEGFSAFEEYESMTEWERFADDTNE